MIVSTYYTCNTYKARIHEQTPTPKKVGKIVYTASCTSSEDQAAIICVTKWYGAKAAETLEIVDERTLDLSQVPMQSRMLKLKFWEFRTY
jgi:hypothetical protein